MGDRSVFDRLGPTPTPAASTPNVPSFKVILVGKVGVGKTALWHRARDARHVHRDHQASTIGVDTCTRTFSTKNGPVSLTAWDTAGVEKFRTLTRNYYRNTHAAMLVFGLDDEESLFSLQSWQKDVANAAPEAVKFLVGNKKDLERMVGLESMNNFAYHHSCQAAFMTSAKTGEGVEEALISVCEHLVAKYQHHSKMVYSDKQWMDGSGLHVHGTQEPESKKCCGL